MVAVLPLILIQFTSVGFSQPLAVLVILTLSLPAVTITQSSLSALVPTPVLLSGISSLPDGSVICTSPPVLDSTTGVSGVNLSTITLKESSDLGVVLSEARSFTV